MIHYHGTPVSGTTDGAARFLMGRHALIPFKRKEHLAIALECCQSVVLDNSAFSYWKTGEDVPFSKYVDWVCSLAYHPALDWCLIPDKIDGSQLDNEKLITKWLRIGVPVLGVPVWHLHEGLDYLEWLVNSFQWVALGSSGEYSKPNTKIWWSRMNEAMNKICDKQGRPPCKLHGLRMLNPKVFTKLPLSSADSTNAGVNGGAIKRFGMYPAPSTHQRCTVIADRIESYNSAHCWEKTL